MLTEIYRLKSFMKEFQAWDDERQVRYLRTQLKLDLYQFMLRLNSIDPVIVGTLLAMKFS